MFLQRTSSCFNRANSFNASCQLAADFQQSFQDLLSCVHLLFAGTGEEACSPVSITERADSFTFLFLAWRWWHSQVLRHFGHWVAHPFSEVLLCLVFFLRLVRSLLLASQAPIQVHWVDMKLYSFDYLFQYSTSLQGRLWMSYPRGPEPYQELFAIAGSDWPIPSHHSLFGFGCLVS